VRVREGRAVKLEGNPNHPINRGKLCARGQAGLQGLYNPDRVRAPLAKNASGAFEPIAWQDAVTRVGERLGAAPAQQVWFVTGNEAGSFERLVSEWMSGLGATGRVVFEPFGYEALRHATQRVFGTDELPYYDFDAARYVLSFGADFLETWGSPVEQTRGFAASHAFRDGKMGRFVHVEPRMSLTGQNADEWIAPAPGTEWMLALSIAHVIVRDRLGSAPAGAARIRLALQDYAPDAVADRCGVMPETIQRLAKEFTAGPSLALGGGMGGQHADAHATAAATHLLNYAAGNVGKTVVFGLIRPAAAAISGLRISPRPCRPARCPCCWCTGPTRHTPHPRDWTSPPRWPRSPSRSPSRASWMRPPCRRM
jgi:molybdopterin-containing oxidoreductase family iron-sulfur binding subunit